MWDWSYQKILFISYLINFLLNSLLKPIRKIINSFKSLINIKFLFWKIFTEPVYPFLTVIFRTSHYRLSKMFIILLKVFCVRKYFIYFLLSFLKYIKILLLELSIFSVLNQIFILMRRICCLCLTINFFEVLI